MVEITFPDGSKKAFNKGITAREIAQSIGQRLAQSALAAKVNDKIVDLSEPIHADSTVQILTSADKEGKEVLWHSSAHLLAMAVIELWPETKLTIGPAIESGFYYDFFKKDPFKPEDLAQIEERMKAIRD